MPYTYEFSDQYPLVQVYIRGRDTFSDHIERIERITSDPRWESNHCVLVDFSETTDFDISTSDLERIAALQHQRNETIGSGKMAVVAPTDFVFGLTRMWEAYMDSEAPSIMQIMVFRNRGNAIEWLGFPIKN